MPDVPTFVELGYAKIDALVYYGAYIPAATPAEVAQRITAEVVQASAAREMVNTREKMGVDDLKLSGPKFAEFFKADLERWGPIVKASGYKAEE